MLLRMLMKLDNLMIISSIIFLFVISCVSVDYKNTGLDEILELEKVTTPDYLHNSKSRILLHFDLTSDTLLTNIKKYYLVLNETEAQEIPLSDTIYAHPLTLGWDMGVGKKFSEPYITDGVSWLYPSVSVVIGKHLVVNMIVQKVVVLLMNMKQKI